MATDIPGCQLHGNYSHVFEVAHLKLAANSTFKKVLGNFQLIEPLAAGIRMRHSLRALPIHLRNGQITNRLLYH
jgi:hypothetical protein